VSVVGLSYFVVFYPYKGPMYYATLFMTEVLGRSNQSQVMYLGVNGGNPSTPGYAVYENGTPMKVALQLPGR
jgi:hypothetical protein